MKPLVSIGMPAFNEASYIGDAIKSVTKRDHNKGQSFRLTSISGISI
jgi:glycosyltransferase involved in cell wall biosynthesis